jgi:hypothetical protein
MRRVDLSYLSKKTPMTTKAIGGIYQQHGSKNCLLQMLAQESKHSFVEFDAVFFS